MKKIITGAVLGSLLIGGAAYSANEASEEVLTPDSELFSASVLMEDAEYDLTEELDDKVLLQNDFADKRLIALEKVKAAGNEHAYEILLDRFNKHVQEMESQLEEAKEDRYDVSEIEAIVAEKSARRGENLALLLEREDLPDVAKEGIAKALENQAKAMERFAAAQLKAQEARGNGEGNGQKGRELAEERAARGLERAAERRGKAEKIVEDQAPEGEEQGEENAENVENTDQSEEHSGEATSAEIERAAEEASKGNKSNAPGRP